MAERQIIIHRTMPKETRIQNSIIWDKKLSIMARFSLIAMLSLPDTWDYSVRGMAIILDISKDTMSKYLREIESAGYLKRIQPHNEKGAFAKAKYIITDNPGDFGEEGNAEACHKNYDTEPWPCHNLSAPVKSPQKKRTEEKNVKKKQTKKSSSELDMLIERFWAVYPRKKGKQDAWRVWEKLNPDKELCFTMAAALKWQKCTAQWTEEGGKYIPYPATWLRHRRWEDEPDETPEAGGYCEEGYDGI